MARTINPNGGNWETLSTHRRKRGKWNKYAKIRRILNEARNSNISMFVCVRRSMHANAVCLVLCAASCVLRPFGSFNLFEWRHKACKHLSMWCRARVCDAQHMKKDIWNAFWFLSYNGVGLPSKVPVCICISNYHNKWGTGMAVTAGSGK